MAIKFQYNKTSLTELGKQLKVRQRALPTLQNKESALRLEVRKAKADSERLIAELEFNGHYLTQYLSIKACLIPVSAGVKYLAKSFQAVSSISVMEMLTSMARSSRA